MRKTLIILSLSVTILFNLPSAFGADKKLQHSADPNVIKLKNISIDKVRKEIIIKSKIAITEGILEYLLVGNQGKAYESVFKVVDNKPSELNFALLLIGCKALNFDDFLKLKDEGNGLSKLRRNHPQSLLKIDILKDGQPYDLQRMVVNREQSAEPFIWVYTGGLMIKDHGYAADLELSYIGIWPDPVAVINLFSGLKNPYQGEFGYEMNKTLVEKLAVDHNFEIVIRN
jgi:hypothetical protein